MNAIRVLPDPDVHGIHGPTGAYASSVWLPVLGPTGFLLWSRLSTVARSTGTITREQLSADLGLGTSSGNQSALTRTLRRLEVFGIVRPTGEATLLVFTELDWVPDRHLRRLHPAVVHRHRRFLDMTTRTAPTASPSIRTTPGDDPASVTAPRTA